MPEVVSNDELVRLAHKGWPRRQRLEARVSAAWADIYCQDAERSVIEIRAEQEGAPTREALHAALKILAGEPDVRDQPSPDAQPPPSLDLSTLSPRELDVVSGLRSGKRLSELAREFGISTHTVRNHLKHTFRKLGVHSQIELMSKIGGHHG